jgi:SSS family solute:Na+ symporter
LLAVIYTDVYQFIVLFIGFIVTCALALPTIAHNWGTITSRLPDTFFMWDGGRGWLFVVTTFLAFLLGETFGPAYVTRYCIGRDVGHTKKGITGVGIALAFTFPFFILIVALYAQLAFPNADSQQSLALVVKHLNNPIFGGLMIAALLSAVMSSADSALNSATTIFTKDLFEHQFKWQDRSDEYILRLARILTVILGVASVLIAILFPDIIGLLLFTYQIWAPAIILPICIGALSSERSSRQAANVYWTMILATVITLLYAYLPIPSLKDLVDQFEPAVFGVCVSAVVYFIIWVGQRLIGGTPKPQPASP